MHIIYDHPHDKVIEFQTGLDEGSKTAVGKGTYFTEFQGIFELSQDKLIACCITVAKLLDNCTLCHQDCLAGMHICDNLIIMQDSISVSMLLVFRHYHLRSDFNHISKSEHILSHYNTFGSQMVLTFRKHRSLVFGKETRIAIRA